MILVTGATGTVGSRVVAELAARGAAVRALVRTPEKAGVLAGLDLEIVHGDLEIAESVAGALAGVDHLFLLTANPPNQPALEGSVVEAAVEAGVEHVVKLSALNAADDSPVEFLRWHRATERLIEESGVGWTHLRPNNFFQNILFQADAIRGQDAFYGPFGDALISSIDVADVAAVAATVLTEPGYTGATLELTGPAAISHAEMAAAVSGVAGKEVNYVDVPFAAARASMLDMGLPEYLADALTTLYEQLAAGSGERVTRTVEEISGRPARTFSEFVREHAAAFSS